MLADSIERTWRLLADSDADPLPLFDRDSLDGLPAASQRLLSRALPAGVPLVRAIELTMVGEIKIGPRWMPFTAKQILRAGVGFVWRPTVGGRLLRFVGVDLLGPDEARMEFRLHGIIPVVRSTGADIARSAAGRLAGETVLWLPHALAPQSGAIWEAVDDDRAIVSLPGEVEMPSVEVTVDAGGRLLATFMQRWNGSAKPAALQSFGGPVHGGYETPDGVRIAGRGTGGWEWTTPGWGGGEFFRYTVEDARPISSLSHDRTEP